MTVRLAEVISWHNAAAEDETSGKATIARIGGDEFACAICYSPSRQDDIDILVEQISDVIARPVRFAGLELETTVSAGLAGHLPRSCEDALTVLNNADIAMYHAKKRGRNRHCWFDPVMEQELRRRGRIEADLPRLAACQEPEHAHAQG